MKIATRMFTLLLLLFTALVAFVPFQASPGGSESASAASEPAVLRAVTGILSAFPSWIAESGQDASEFGWSAASAGDVNGDGYDDVIVGASRYDGAAYRSGAAFVYYGSPSGLSSTPDWIAPGEQKGSRFGAAVSSAGDLNCDGYADVIVGAPRYNHDQPGEGTVFVYYGSENGLSSAPDWSYESDQNDAELGYSVAPAGDVDHDGCDDLLVGARWYNGGSSSDGAAFLFLGSASFEEKTQPDWHAYGEQAGATFGTAVSGAGDVNQDGYADLLVGAPYFNGSQQDSGAVFLFLGSAEGPGETADWMVESGQLDALFGTAVGTGGDVNADGYDDILIGAPQFANSQAGIGAAFAYFGSESGPAEEPDWIAGFSQTGSAFGTAVGPAGDVNQDGYDDIIVGAPHFSDDQPDEGAAMVYLGGVSGLSTSPNWMGFGNKNDTWFGFAAAAAGDINQDGHADVIVGAPLYRWNDLIMGRAFAYYGLPEEELSFSIVLPLVLRISP
jgi:hypothetical protein